jgi:hypothetical protein
MLSRRYSFWVSMNGCMANPPEPLLVEWRG